LQEDNECTIKFAKEGETLPLVSEIIVLGAAYGPADVTKIVKNYVNGSKLSINASNEIFGDSWPNV